MKSLEGKPFALLGVSADADRDEVRRVTAAKGLTWRSWWDGGVDGPIAARWGVTGWPTLFVLDGNGVVRYQVHSAAELDRAVETLLRELEGA